MRVMCLNVKLGHSTPQPGQSSIYGVPGLELCLSRSGLSFSVSRFLVWFLLLPIHFSSPHPVRLSEYLHPTQLAL